MSSPTPSPGPAVDDTRFRLFVASVTDYAIYMLSPEGIVNSWNAGAQRFKGYTGDEIIGRHFSAFYTPEDRAQDLPARALATALSTGKCEDEGWRMRKDGTRFWASVVIDPIRDEDGVLVGFAKITRDITERKRAAEALHASEERFRLLVQGVTDYAIYMLSPSGMVTNWNAGARRIKGYDEQEVIGTHFSRFYTREEAANGMPARALANAAREGRFENEGWRVRKDGTRFWAHVVIDPIYSQMGELVGFAKVTRDITERQQAAMALEQAKEALFQSQKLEAIGKLTGGVAHDFNNLLSVMVNGLGVLKGRLTEPAEVRVLDAMERAAARGATLTQQLLAFARQQPLKQEYHNMNDIVGTFEAVLRRAVPDALSFDIELADNLPTVLVDAAQVEASILNLVVNARDATPPGGRIVLRTGAATLAPGQVGALAAGSYVSVAIVDSGAGMSADVAARAVEPFFTTKAIGKGTGLGLSQVYGLVQHSGGDVAIRSAPGAGTAVTLYFPAVGAGQGAAPAAASEKALVVDDQQDVLEMAAELFRSLGYEVLSANNGPEALAILKRTPNINVLFSDVVMPHMTGFELAREARQLAPAMKIILATGHAGPARGAGGSGGEPEVQLISKPYTMAQLLRQLR